MKKKLSFTFLCLLAFVRMSVSAQDANVIIFSEDGEKFTVVMNGLRYNETPQTNVQVLGVKAGVYKTKILFENSSVPELNKTIYPEAGQEATFAIKFNERKGEHVMRITSVVPITSTSVSNNVAPPTQTNVVVVPVPAQPVNQTTTSVNTNGMGVNSSVTIVESSTTTTTSGVNPVSDNVAINMNVGGVNVGGSVSVSGMDMMGNEMGAATTTTTTVTTTESFSTTGNVGMNTNMNTGGNVPPPAQVIYVPGYTGAVGCPVPMDETSFNDATNSIKSKTFADSKMTVAKQIISNNCLTATQVKNVVKLFDFEADRVEFAKYAYRYTYDLNNYFKVNDAFDFESSIEELDEYIQGQR